MATNELYITLPITLSARCEFTQAENSHALLHFYGGGSVAKEDYAKARMRPRRPSMYG